MLSTESHKNIKIVHIAVAKPVIHASNAATSFNISGTSVTLTCVSASDFIGSGTYKWNLDGQSLCVLSGLLA